MIVEKQDDPKPLLTKYWISPLAVTPRVTLCPPACSMPTWPRGHALITNKHNALAQLAIQQMQNKNKNTESSVSFTRAQTKGNTLTTNEQISKLCRNMHVPHVLTAASKFL